MVKTYEFLSVAKDKCKATKESLYTAFGKGIFIKSNEQRSTT